MPTPIFTANDLSSWYGSGTLTSQPWQGSGSGGLYGSLSAMPSVGGGSPYQFSDITTPVTQETTDYRPAVAKGGFIPEEYATRYDSSLYTVDANGNKVAKAAISKAGTPGGDALYGSRSANLAYGLAERARQEAAAGRQENRERGNAILAGYDQNIANNRAMSDRILAMNAGYGDSMRQQLSNDYASRLASSNQFAIRRGLGNTTIRDSLNRGVTSAYDLSRMQLGDQLTQRNIGLTTDALGRENQGVAQRLGFLGSVQNDYPTSADYGNYLLQSGVLEETKGSRK